MTTAAYPTLFRSVPARFESDFSIEESVRRLRAVVKQSMFDGLFEHCAIGRVLESGVRVGHATPMARGNRVVFKGCFQSDGGRVSLVGRFTWPIAVQIGSALYVAFCLFLAAVGAWMAITGMPEAAILTGVGITIAALVWLSPRLARKDVVWISEMISNTLRPGIATTSASMQAITASRSRCSAMVLVQCLLGIVTLFALASAVSGIAAILQGPNGIIVVRHDVWSRSAAVVGALLSAGAAYGVHRRRLIAWQFGMIALPVGGLCALLQMPWLANIQLPANLPPVVRWFAIAFMSVGVVAVTAFWTWWWKGQRKQFETNRNEQTVKSTDEP